jgi:hypothetical protein
VVQLLLKEVSREVGPTRRPARPRRRQNDPDEGKENRRRGEHRTWCTRTYVHTPDEQSDSVRQTGNN